MTFRLKKTSALNLTLEGSIGTFRVGAAAQDQNSLEVKYFLTYVGLNFSEGPDKALLNQLAPVREIFEVNQLGFDEIMQRDIDDARVSSELIPYLLDDTSKDLVKLFPPIVVIILPVQENINKPGDFYPAIEHDTTKKPDELGDADIDVLRAGTVGKEVFQFEQPILEGSKLDHDFARLKISTTNSKLVIVDGQHRAMALLALYRNLKDQWSDAKRFPFKRYYEHWTPKYIEKFNLKEIKLPAMLCTFPDLDSNYEGEYDIKKAARSIFLTLNRSARKVSKSRNILLDDNDIIAYFLRSCLTEIKNKDLHSESSLRIFNVELDQSEKDRVKLSSPIAITGVSHLYYIIEHLLLNEREDINGVKSRSGNFSQRTDLTTYLFMNRLDGRDLLGGEFSESTKRDHFTLESAKKLTRVFQEKYGNFIVSFFEKIKAYEFHNKAVLDLEKKIEVDQDRQLKPILFEGQGISRVFEAHRENLKQDIQKGVLERPGIRSIYENLNHTAERVEKRIEGFRKERAELCLEHISNGKNKLKSDSGDFFPEISKWFDRDFYSLLTTIAFQTGLVSTFFAEVEKLYNQNFQESNNIGLENLEEYFEEYTETINNFLTPNTYPKFKKLVGVLTGEIQDSNDELKVISTNKTFRSIVFSGQMQPNQFPKYKYLLLEIWQPSDSGLAKVVSEERLKCREQVFSDFYDKQIEDYGKKKSKMIEQLTSEDKDSIFESSYRDYEALLSNLGAEEKPDRETLKNWVNPVRD
jgi:hypothetical protein